MWLSHIEQHCFWRMWLKRMNCCQLFDFLISLQLTEELHKISWRGRTVITKLHKVAIFSILNEETFGISTAKTVTINKPYKGNYIFPLLLTILLIYGISIDLSFTIYQHTIIKHNLKMTIYCPHLQPWIIS